MGRAFREGVEDSRKIDATTPVKRWRPLDRLSGLTNRTKNIQQSMGPLVDVPAMIRIENEMGFRTNLRRGNFSVNSSFGITLSTRNENNWGYYRYLNSGKRSEKDGTNGRKDSANRTDLTNQNRPMNQEITPWFRK